jgi:hypothetical protein
MISLYIIVFVAIPLQSYLLFWFGALSLLTLSFITVLISRNHIVKIIAILTFNIMIGYTTEIIYQHFWNGVLLPVADTNFSIQLVDIILKEGHIFPPQGTFRAITYSYYPVSFIIGALFTQITGTSSYSFAFFVYPLISRLMILLIFFLVARYLLKNTTGAYIATLIFTLNQQLLLFYCGFHYEQIAWIFTLMALYSTFKLWFSKKLIFIPIMVINVFLSAAAHHFTSYILFAFLLSACLLNLYTIVYSKIFTLRRLKSGFKNVFQKTLLPITVILVIKIYMTLQGEKRHVVDILRETVNRILGLSSKPAGFGKFTPWNYSSLEVSIILIGNVALLVFSILAFFLSLKSREITSRLLEILAIANGVLLFTLFMYSPFGGVEAIRFFMPYSLIASLLIGSQLDALFNSQSGYRKLCLTFMLIIVLSSFFSAQVAYSKYHSVNRIGDKPLVLTSYIEPTINFIAKEGDIKPNVKVIAYPLTYFESVYSRLMISSPYSSSPQAAEAISMNGLKLAADGYLILYSPLHSEFVHNFVSPEIRDEWVNSIYQIYFNCSRLYDNEKVAIFHR